MNVISYDAAYCLFPRATLEERRSLLSWSSEARSVRREEALNKYSARGFHMLEFLDDDVHFTPEQHRVFPFGPRWLGDAHTWTIRLTSSANGVLPPPPNPYSPAGSQDPVALTSFSMHYDHENGAIMKFVVIQCPALKVSYVMADDEGERGH